MRIVKSAIRIFVKNYSNSTRIRRISNEDSKADNCSNNYSTIIPIVNIVLTVQPECVSVCAYCVDQCISERAEFAMAFPM